MTIPNRINLEPKNLYYIAYQYIQNYITILFCTCTKRYYDTVFVPTAIPTILVIPTGGIAIPSKVIWNIVKRHSTIYWRNTSPVEVPLE